MQRKSVDLPPPEGPMMAATSPERTLRSTPLRTRWLPCDFSSFSTRMRCSMSVHHPFLAFLQPPREQSEWITHEQREECGHQREMGKRPRRPVGCNVKSLAQLLDGDDRANRCVLEQVDKVVGHGWNN